jgi:starvation-inducible DNA-binding protein
METAEKTKKSPAKEASTHPSQMLNKLLSTYQIFVMNVRGFHWNIQDKNFFDMHIQYEKLYNELLDKIDQLAERMLAIELRPLHAYSDYIRQSLIEECKDIHKSHDINREIVASLKIIGQLEQECIENAEKLKDFPTHDMLTAFLEDHQKKAWMFSATLK